MGWSRQRKISTQSLVFLQCLDAWKDVSKSHDFKRIEREERRLKRMDEVVEWRDFGAGCPPEGKSRKSSVSSMARAASSDRRKGQWLMAAARAAQQTDRPPLRMLELGTCLGSGGDYLLSGAPKGTFYMGLEGSASLADWTQRRLQWHVDAGSDVHIQTGPFERTLPALIASKTTFDVVFLDGCHEGQVLLGQWREIQPLLSPDFIVVVDDIRWSKDMHAAWLELCSEPQVAALDVFRMGILIPNRKSGPSSEAVRVAWHQRA